MDTPLSLKLPAAVLSARLTAGRRVDLVMIHTGRMGWAGMVDNRQPPISLYN